MSDGWTRGVILGLLAVIVGVPFLLRPASRDVALLPDGSNHLVIVSPHNEQIRSETARGFNEHRRSRGLSPVRIDWRASGGTSDMRKMVLSAFEAEARNAQRDGRPIGGIGYDLFFGGGDFEHDTLARGVSFKLDDQEVKFSVTVPIELPEGLLQRVYPSPLIGDAPLYHKELKWVGVVLASFGIIYNNDLHTMLELPAPRAWDDLQRPAYFGQVALSDPGHSGSAAAAYDAVIRRLGWAEGWRLLRRVFANARYFTSSATKVPVDVSAGEAAAGMCIDFYGRFQAGSVRAGRVGYFDPPRMSQINADPISILRGAPSQELAQRQGRPAMEGLANQFVIWLLSEEAQNLWQRRLGEPDGPRQFELRRLPIRRDVYAPANMATWTDTVNPFEIAAPFGEGVPSFYQMVAPVAKAIAIDVHDDLKAAWRAMHDHPDHPRRAEMWALFDAMPEDLVIEGPPRDWVRAKRARYEADREAMGEDRLRWTLIFREKYRRIVALASR